MATPLPPSGAVGAGGSAGSASSGSVSAGVVEVQATDQVVASPDIFPPPFEIVEVAGTPAGDVLIGDSDNERMLGLRGNDVLFGAGGDDQLDGGIGDDRLEGGPGFDSYDGGPGRDTLTFSVAPGPAFVDLSIGQVIEGQAFEFVDDVENVRGSDFGDTLLGDDDDNVLEGGAGLDLLGGGLGDDRLVGGEDGAYATWAGSGGAVVVNLATGIATEGDGGVDRLSDILGAVGTGFDDRLSGNRFDNRLEGGLGDDTLEGRGGADILVGGDGADSLNGGAGRDLVDYSGGGPVRVDLLAGIAVDQAGATDTLANIEDVLGSLGADVLVGGGGANRLEGSVGADQLTGNGGADTFVFQDRLDFGDTILDFSGNDRIEIARAAVGDEGRVFFDAPTDRLLLDIDGDGDAPLLLVADVEGEAVGAQDWVVV